MTLDALTFGHIVGDAAATDCVDRGIGFFHGQAIEDCAYTGFGEAVWATFGRHKENNREGH